MNFLGLLSKNTQVSNFIKIRPVGFQLFHADGQTAMTKLIDAVRNFANAPKSSEGQRHTCHVLHNPNVFCSTKRY
jgi:hypothetical protein